MNKDISNDCATWFGVVPLSQAVREKPADVQPLSMDRVPADIGTSLALWTRNIRSAGFRSSVRRAGAHAHNKVIYT